MAIYLAGIEYDEIHVAGMEVSKLQVGGQEYHSAAPSPTHTLEFSIGNNGYNSPLGRGSISSGFSFSYRTPGGKDVTIIHFRRVSNEVNFALSGATANAGKDPAEFPSRIVVRKLTGGEVEREFTPQAGSLRDISGGVRQDYDSTSGSASDVFVNGQTVRAQLYY